VPLAQRAAAAGHEVAFASGAAFCATIEAAGFRAYPAGFDYAGAPLDTWFPQLRQLTGDAYTRFVARQIRVQTQAHQMVPDLLRLTQTVFRPDLLVRDAAEYGGCVAAERLGVPHASVRTACTPSSFARRFLVGVDLADLRREFDLGPDPRVEMPFRYLHLACEPPGFSPPNEAPAPTSRLLQPVMFDQSAADPPSWPKHLPAGPTICATLGTFMNRCTDVFAAILDGLRDEPLNLVVLVGRDMDPSVLGSQPDNVHVARYIPLSLVLPRCDLVISHAGYNTLMATLLNGLPSVLIPLGADQPENARSSARLGVARVLEPTECSPEAIRAAVRDVLSDPRYRVRAQLTREAMARLPSIDHGLSLLERLARERRPLRPSAQELPS